MERVGGSNGTMPDITPNMSPEQQGLINDLRENVDLVMAKLQESSSVKAMITKKQSEIKSVVRPLKRHLPTNKNREGACCPLKPPALTNKTFLGTER